MSNPCNPTGKLVRDEELASWVSLARELDCAMLFDEFYSHYIWKGEGSVSAAQFVEDVDRDPIVLVDGLTKNWRYPGWRVCWTVGPKSVIAAAASAGSFLDGGPSRPRQRAAVPRLTGEHVAAETRAIRDAFAPKRQMLVDGLSSLGVRLDLEPEGTFYAWGDLSGLPEGLRDGQAFFQAALAERVITVPGDFFDVDPGRRRSGRPSRFARHARFSFGPSADTLRTALRRLEGIIGYRS